MASADLLYEALVDAQASRRSVRKGIKIKAPSLDGRRPDGDGRIQQKRSDTLNKNLSRPIPRFSATTTLGEMRKRTGEVSESGVRRVAEQKSK